MRVIFNFLDFIFTLPFKIVFLPITIPLKISGLFRSFGLGKKCPRCGSLRLTEVKPDFYSKYMAASTMLWAGAGQKPKNLNVCKSCDFSWEDR